MKSLFTFAVALIVSIAASAQLKDGKYIVDYAASSITWKASKVTGSGHNGAVRVSSGVVNVAKNAITTAKLKVDMNSMSCADLTDASYNANLINHLKGEDFFNTAKFPDAQFEITSVTEKKSGNYTHEVKGKMTVKGITQDITFPATVNEVDGKLNINGEFTFDRSKFDVRYGSTSFFNDLGDKAINNDVVLTFNIIAKI